MPSKPKDTHRLKHFPQFSLIHEYRRHQSPTLLTAMKFSHSFYYSMKQNHQTPKLLYDLKFPQFYYSMNSDAIRAQSHSPLWTFPSVFIIPWIQMPSEPKASQRFEIFCQFSLFDDSKPPDSKTTVCIERFPQFSLFHEFWCHQSPKLLTAFIFSLSFYYSMSQYNQTPKLFRNFSSFHYSLTENHQTPKPHYALKFSLSFHNSMNSEAIRA